MATVVVVAPPRVIRQYSSLSDLYWLYGLWQRTMPDRWSLSLIELQTMIARATFSLILEQAGTPVGFCAVGYKKRGPAGIMVVLVEPAVQRGGVGTALLNKAEQALKEQGVAQLKVGSGNDSNYFWPGAPSDANAWPFFAARGWKEEETSFDLEQDLSNYTTPAWVYARLSKGVTLHLAEPTLRSKIIAFERRQFPSWAEFYENAMRNPGEMNIVVALNPAGEIVGSVLVEAAKSTRWNPDPGAWRGTINVLGVAEEYQSQGIGLALAAKAMERLKDGGCIKCHIQWTGLIDWYGKLGTKIWAEYHMGSKELT